MTSLVWQLPPKTNRALPVLVFVSHAGISLHKIMSRVIRAPGADVFHLLRIRATVLCKGFGQLIPIHLLTRRRSLASPQIASSFLFASLSLERPLLQTAFLQRHRERHP